MGYPLDLHTTIWIVNARGPVFLLQINLPLTSVGWTADSRSQANPYFVVKKSVNRRLFTFYTSNSRCGKCCQVLATTLPQISQLGSLLWLSSEHTEYANSWRNVIGHLVYQHYGNGCSINHAPPLWWQSTIAFAGSCTFSEYFPSSIRLLQANLLKVQYSSSLNPANRWSHFPHKTLKAPLKGITFGWESLLNHFQV